MQAGDIVKVISNGNCYPGAAILLQAKLPTLHNKYNKGLPEISNGTFAEILYETETSGYTQRYVIKPVNSDTIQVIGKPGIEKIGVVSYKVLGVYMVTNPMETYSQYRELFTYHTPTLESNFKAGFLPKNKDIVEVIHKCRHLTTNSEIYICRKVDTNICFAISINGLKKHTEEEILF